MNNGSFDSSCPFARLATALLTHAQKLDPSRPAAPIAEIASRLVAQGPGALPHGSPKEIEQLFQSLDLMPFSAARID
jgi:hypothetical protein